MAEILDIHEAAQALQMFWELRKKKAISLKDFREYKELLDAKMLSGSTPSSKKDKAELG